jgi:hypothetical protein|tara:strand:+ start:1204 stop:1614 length:411 start_codon:yes stop_codon:yes gene_type:complete
MIGLLLSCSLTVALPTVDDFTEYIQCREDQHKIEHTIQWLPLIDKYFDRMIKTQVQALKVIYCESSGKSNAVGINKDGTKDIGLWQFNDNTWAWLTPKLNIQKERTDPETATAVAAWLIKHDGWHHWNSSKHCWGG